MKPKTETEIEMIEQSSQIIPYDAEWDKSNQIAEMCKAIVLATAVEIEGRKHIPVEAWQSIAAAWGCTPGTKKPQRTDEDDGWECEAYLKRDSDGAILSTAFGYVGDDDSRWANGKMFARKSMVQTRATSRVCANKFRFIPVLMKIEGLSTTPAEEMQGVADARTEGRQPLPPRKAKGKQVPTLPPSDQPWPEELPVTSDKTKERKTLTGVITAGSKKPQEQGGFVWYANLGKTTLWTREADIGEWMHKADGCDCMMKVLINPDKPNSVRVVEIKQNTQND
jgi:hypothetical protein